MKDLISLLIAVVAMLAAACDNVAPRTSATNDAVPSQKPSYFTRKKECAEIGYHYFQRSKAEMEAFAGKAQAAKWVRNGPLTTYNPERDSCLVAWTEFVADKDINGRYFQVHAGYLYDALTNEDLAHYGYTKDADGSIRNSEEMTEEQYKAKIKQLMGIIQP